MMLKGKIAVVTGAGRGIGREIALLMARHGAQVVVNDYGGSAAGSGAESAPADEVVSEITKAGGKATANYDSVASMAGGQAIIKKAVDTFGRVDIVVNNAGILRDRMIFNMTEEERDAVINTHLKGSFAVTRAAAPLMREQKGLRRVVRVQGVLRSRAIENASAQLLIVDDLELLEDLPGTPPASTRAVHHLQPVFQLLSKRINAVQAAARRGAGATLCQSSL